MTAPKQSAQKPTKKAQSPTKQAKPKESATIETKSNHGQNREATEITIKALRDDGLISEVDAARVQIVRSLASLADAEPENPVVWREYRLAEQALRKETEAHGDPFDKLLADITAEMGNEKKQKTTNPRK
jgi:hypothetical protein